MGIEQTNYDLKCKTEEEVAFMPRETILPDGRKMGILEVFLKYNGTNHTANFNRFTHKFHRLESSNDRLAVASFAFLDVFGYMPKGHEFGKEYLGFVAPAELGLDSGYVMIPYIRD